MPRVLIIEDDPRMVEAIEKTLSLKGGYETRSCGQPDQAVKTAVQFKPDLILLDVRLPGGDGRMVLKALKENAAVGGVPVIFLTGMSAESDKVLGLNLGADDYVVKPFSAAELLARIQAVHRRYAGPGSGGPGPDVLESGGVKLDRANRAAWVGAKALKLQPREFEVLYLLVASAGRALSRRHLIENSSSYGMEVSSRSLDTHIKNIRRKLGAKGGLIETVPKLGYRFKAEA